MTKEPSKNSAEEDIHESTRVNPTLPPESRKKQKQQHYSGLVVTDCKYFPVSTEFDKKNQNTFFITSNFETLGSDHFRKPSVSKFEVIKK